VPIHVSEALDNDNAIVLTVERKSGGSYVGGIYQTGTTSSFKTLASVQQPTPEELQNLAEGERSKDIRKFITKKPVRTSSDKDGLIADIIVFKSKRYKVISLKDWDLYGYSESFGARDQ